MTKSKTQTITSTILSDTDLKKIKLSINDGKNTTCYLKFTNDLKENTKKGIYISREINSAGRKMGLELYQTTTGCEDVCIMLKPINNDEGYIDEIEISVGIAGLGDLLITKCNYSNYPGLDGKELKHSKYILIDLIKSNIDYVTNYLGNPIGLK
jgi:hypothetical protein